MKGISEKLRRNRSMVSNLWGHIHLVCGCHDLKDGYVIMEPHEAASSNMASSLYGNASMNMFYSCPKYYPNNRKESEPECRNHISMKEFEEVLNHITDHLMPAILSGKDMDLTGLKWMSKRGVQYEVIKCEKGDYYVKCVNSRALWKK